MKVKLEKIKQMGRSLIVASLSIGLICFLLLLSGCSSSVGEKAAQYNFKQGVTGLGVSFLENAPPKTVYPFSDFKVIVKLDNQAAYDLTNGIVRIIGLDEKYVQIYPTEQSFERLLGRSLTTPSGETAFLEFQGSSNGLFQNAENYEANFFMVISYLSTVEFTDTVCINPSMYEVYDSGCKMQVKKAYSGQGAPIAVSEVEEIVAPGGNSEVEFRIKLRNFGQGIVKFANLNKAWLGNEELNCKFQGEENEKSASFTGKKQEAVLVCKKLLTNSNSYTTTLSIEFNYDYELKKSERITLTK